MKRILIIASVVTVLVCALLLCGGVAFASTSTEGFTETLKAGLDGLKAYFDFLIEALKLTL